MTNDADPAETVRTGATRPQPGAAPADDSEAVRACYREHFGADPTPGSVAALLGVPLAPETKAQLIHDLRTLVHVTLDPYLREANALGAALYDPLDDPPPSAPAPAVLTAPLTRRRSSALMKRKRRPPGRRKRTCNGTSR